MIRIKWKGQDEPPPAVSKTLRERLTVFIHDKVEGLNSELEREYGYFDITDADNPAQLSIIPKGFSPVLTKKILRKFAE
jgi:hypothetical protein